MAGIFMINLLGIKSKKYDEIRKIATWQRDYTTGCLLDYQYFKDHYQLIANKTNQILIKDLFSKLNIMEC